MCYPLIAFQVMPEAEVLVAWTTKVIVSLTGWWDSTDGTNLRCHLYYYNLLDTEGSVATRLTTLPMNLEESFTFTLPEGSLWTLDPFHKKCVLFFL